MAYPQELVAFLDELAQNNNRDWFEANRPRYVALRSTWTDLVQQLILRLAGVDGELEGLAAERALFRIHRDVRFAKDKAPYKTTFSALLSPAAKDVLAPGYYMQVAAEGTLMVGGGIWMPDSAGAHAIRTQIAAQPARLRAILAEPAFAALYRAGFGGEQLKRAPKGFDEAHPAIDLLKHKNFAVTHQWPIDAATTRDELLERALAGLAPLAPLVQFLRAAVRTVPR